MHAVTNPADGLSPLRGVVVGLIAVLALIGLIELLTTVGGTVREGERDLLALKAIGLSPRQITAVARHGHRLHRAGSGPRGYGARAASGALADRRPGEVEWDRRRYRPGAVPASAVLFGLAAVLGAAALAALPAGRAARRRLADTLSAVA